MYLAFALWWSIFWVVVEGGGYILAGRGEWWIVVVGCGCLWVVMDGGGGCLWVLGCYILHVTLLIL